MRYFFPLVLIGLFTSLSAQEIITYPYNPDSDGNAFVASADMLETLAVFGSVFTPAEIQIDGVALTEVITQLQSTLTLQQVYIEQLQQYISVTDQTVLISGANLQVVNGDGMTDVGVNGTGNIIIGYNEDNGDVKSGSHNLVVGKNHTYSSYGGIVLGIDNSIEGAYSSVSGGLNNTASGDGSSVSGGRNNTASAYNSSVSGGWQNTASGNYSSVSGGYFNTASGLGSFVLGGLYNTASGNYSSASGGFLNTASGDQSSVVGDAGNTFFDNSADGNTVN
ncbi:MAG TPA: hypothetical protein EYN67_17080 [Flavobacteriales bacterium]|nr:hypothetical protein [Flavobacteriales bacterium]